MNDHHDPLGKPQKGSEMTTTEGTSTEGIRQQMLSDAVQYPATVLPLAALVGGYVAASMGASFVVARRSGWRHLVRLPLAYVCMHLAYGVGFLVGLVRRAFGQPVATPQEAETP